VLNEAESASRSLEPAAGKQVCHQVSAAGRAEESRRAFWQGVEKRYLIAFMSQSLSIPCLTAGFLPLVVSRSAGEITEGGAGREDYFNSLRESVRIVMPICSLQITKS
jgi:hypothetical protein